MLMPKKVKYRKQQRGRMTGQSLARLDARFRRLRAEGDECGWVTDRQIEAARIAMTRFIKRGGKVWIRLFPDKPITKKPAETRMGKGKGAPEAVGGRDPAGQDSVRDGRRSLDIADRGDAAGGAEAVRCRRNLFAREDGQE